jgi:hypothetical protein
LLTAMLRIGMVRADEHLTEGSGPFQKRVLQEIYAVLPYDRDRFYLHGERTSPLFLYADGQSPAEIECRQNVAFKMNSGEAAAGAIHVSVCPEHTTRLRSLAIAGHRGTEAELARLRGQGPGTSPEKLRAAGWFTDRATLPDGSEENYFAVLLIGHGVIGLPTVILLAKTSAVVVQASNHDLCGYTGGGPFPLCADPRAALTAIARRVAAAFP